MPELLRVLSPLRSVTEPGGLARSVAEWVVATVASGCQVHLAKGGGDLTTLVDLHDGAGPGDDVLRRVMTSSRTELVAGRAADRVWVVLPLRGDGQTIGTLSMLVGCPSTGLEPSHHHGLSIVASTLARAMLESMSQQRAHNFSQALQASLLPNALPERDGFDLAARYLPGTADLRIGGDWYDSQVMPDGSIALSVGDVAGHGVEAAAQMGELRSAMIALRLVRSAPDQLISVVHRLASDRSYFATVVCARLDSSGHLQWASAGHLPPLVIHTDGSTELLPTDQSPPLGTGHTGPVPVNRCQLRSGDIVLVYTDGLVERRDIDIEECLRMLAARAAAPSRRSLDEIIDRLVEARDHPLSTGDDVAILGARWVGRPA